MSEGQSWVERPAQPPGESWRMEWLKLQHQGMGRDPRTDRTCTGLGRVTPKFITSQNLRRGPSLEIGFLQIRLRWDHAGLG